MSRTSECSDIFIASQQRMLRLAARDYALTPAAIHAETGISLPTIKSWSAKEASAISGPMLVKLAACIPNELMSLLFEPAGKSLFDTESGSDDIDELVYSLTKLLHAIADAKRSGPIDHRSRAEISDLARQVSHNASGVAR